MNFLERPSLKVNFNGDEYLDYVKYRDSNKKRMSKKHQLGLLIIGICFLALLIPVFIIDSMFTQTLPSAHEKVSNMVNVANLSWTQLGKILLVQYGWFLALGVAVGWAINGVGFLIIRR